MHTFSTNHSMFGRLNFFQGTGNFLKNSESMQVITGDSLTTKHSTGNRLFLGISVSEEDLLHWEIRKGDEFWGCMMKKEIKSTLTESGCIIFDNPLHLPFEVFRGRLYSQTELEDANKKIVDWIKSNTMDFITTERDAFQHDVSMKHTLRSWKANHSTKSLSDHHIILLRETDRFIFGGSLTEEKLTTLQRNSVAE
jgi:hypothetical protein